jgi:two-component system cell cycle sensor histidine kinase/response regulator CckA
VLTLSHARLLHILMLLMALSAGASISLSWHSRVSGVDHSTVGSSSFQNLPSSLMRTPSRLGSWQKVLYYTNPGVAAAYVINFFLAAVILVLIRRNGRYRQTLFAKAFRSSPLAITISTFSEGRYLDVNYAFLQMLGYERRDVIGRTAAELGIWADPADRKRMLEHLRGAAVSKGLNTRLRTTSGEIRETNLSAELIDVDGVPCILAVTQDVTDARRLETQLRQAYRMGAVGRLAGGVAHDFNNILTVIIGYSELAALRLGSGHSVSKHLHEIKVAADRAASLTRQLLAFSRQQVLYPRVLDLNALVNNLTRMLQRLIGEDITLSFRPGAAGNIKADAGQIEQILMNLVVNGRDAMPGGGSIAIETSDIDLDQGYVDSHLSVRPGRYVMLTVTDTGCGMDEKTLSQIFEPFFTTKAPGQGTGLGLSMVYGIVKQSEGYIWVYSEVARGTTFKLYFPRYTQGGESRAEPSPSVPELAIAAETILIVEDDDTLRKLMSALLAESGYRVLEAGNGDAAIELVQGSSENIHLLLSDILMPVMSGIELSTRLKKLRPNLRILLMSGYAGDLLARYRVEDSEIGLIEKPFTRHGLLTKIGAALQ